MQAFLLCTRTALCLGFIFPITKGKPFLVTLRNTLWVMRFLAWLLGLSTVLNYMWCLATVPSNPSGGSFPGPPGSSLTCTHWSLLNSRLEGKPSTDLYNSVCSYLLFSSMKGLAILASPDFSSISLTQDWWTVFEFPFPNPQPEIFLQAVKAGETARLTHFLVFQGLLFFAAWYPKSWEV